MNLGNLINSLNKYDFESFKTEYLSQNLNEKLKQSLLVKIFESGYNHKQFSFYKKIFDLIIEGRLNVNFVSDDLIETPFLFLVAQYAPHIELFDYFIDKGAKLNFYIQEEDFYELQTCLDFVNKYIEDAIIDDVEVYFYDVKTDYSTIHNNKVCVDKEDYEQLIKQSAHLFSLRKTVILRNHIIAIGGKRYQELNQK